jgi:hypothetical protein
MSKHKDEMRKRLASLSFTEKIKILEKLRERSLTIAASGLRAHCPCPTDQIATQMITQGTKTRIVLWQSVGTNSL